MAWLWTGVISALAWLFFMEISRRMTTRNIDANFETLRNVIRRQAERIDELEGRCEAFERRCALD